MASFITGGFGIRFSLVYCKPHTREEIIILTKTKIDPASKLTKSKNFDVVQEYDQPDSGDRQWKKVFACYLLMTL